MHVGTVAGVLKCKTRPTMQPTAISSMATTLKSSLAWLGSHVNIVLIVALLVVATTWGFVALAGEVKEGDTQKFDNWAVRVLRQPNDPATPVGPKWLPEVGRDLTALGGVAVLTLVTTAVAGYLLLAEKNHLMWLMLGAIGSGLLLSTALKHVYDRPRPELVPHLSGVYTTSFPSGHSMLSAIAYLTLGALLTRTVESRVIKFYFIAVALTLSFLVGVSRVYMGVHYPTDVLAGWAAGLAWALLWWLIARYLQHRGVVENEDPKPE
jgi:undecaprenyl-diphosphatase